MAGRSVVCDQTQEQGHRQRQRTFIKPLILNPINKGTFIGVKGTFHRRMLVPTRNEHVLCATRK